MKHLFAGIGLLAFALSAPAAIYKWTDAEGNVHYSEQPPLEQPQQVEELDIPETPAGAETEPEAATASATTEDGEAAAGESAPEEDISKLTPDELKQRNCSRAKAYLKSLQDSAKVSGGQVAIEKDGKLTPLDQSQLQEKIKKAQENVGIYCP